MQPTGRWKYNSTADSKVQRRQNPCRKSEEPNFWMSTYISLISSILLYTATSIISRFVCPHSNLTIHFAKMEHKILRICFCTNIYCDLYCNPWVRFMQTVNMSMIMYICIWAESWCGIIQCTTIKKYEKDMEWFFWVKS